ncbi:Helix-turn-helix [Jeotgalicoccus saudimassiliensis]|uniref:Helix-turn-helix n=1 Tax=Jeotgalicoccus saudimassiliensis TaxID=1461582 RepID=A0A078MCB0_9STAP|nr:helix-turn-helix transcriptional regulator [Jeotgalicoccus saudimassiliensis]CEA02351.1 Helix-turn-helix [Jeotgalicoccus saudimassiliensis]
MKINNSAIISRRKEYGVSQSSLSLKTGVSVSTISRLEKGENVGFVYVVKIMTALDLTLEDVIIRLTPAVDMKITEELDLIREQSRLDLLEKTLNKITLNEWRSNNKLSVYYDWHRAIVLKMQNDSAGALKCLDNAFKRIEDKSSLEYLKAGLYMAKGNVLYGDGSEGLYYYTQAAHVYSSNSDKVYYRTAVKLYINLMRGYGSTKEYSKILQCAKRAKNLLQKNESTFLLKKIEWLEKKALEALNEPQIV